MIDYGRLGCYQSLVVGFWGPFMWYDGRIIGIESSYCVYELPIYLCYLWFWNFVMWVMGMPKTYYLGDVYFVWWCWYYEWGEGVYAIGWSVGCV